MKLDVLKSDGGKADSTIELSPTVFGIEPNEHCMHLAVNAELANMRQGTHKAKTRGEVRGGGRKPWRQKGRGTARSGSNRSPIWVGGGTTFGPRPHLYTKKINRKIKRLARRSALSVMFKKDRIIVVDEVRTETPKTKEFAELLKTLNLSGKKLTVLVETISDNLYLATRNIPNVFVLPADRASTYDILDCEVLLMEKSATEKLNSVLKV